jgi:aminotransferase in exopolysaccharide biosynthesis
MKIDIDRFAPRFCTAVRDWYDTDEFIPLHAPKLSGNEESYVREVVQSTFVSSVGQKIIDFEQAMCRYLGVKHAVAMVNGTAALHMALVGAGVTRDSLVITQSLSFVATANAIAYVGATPVFLDIDPETLSLSPGRVRDWLRENSEERNGVRVHAGTGARIAAIVPMHTFGFVGEIEELLRVAQEYGIPLVEDAAESLGTEVAGVHPGNFGLCGAISVNGNKILTTGGGGMVVTNDDQLAANVRHLSTTAKVPHRWEYIHDQVGYNYRMPNINAGLGLAQLEQLPKFLESKRALARYYADLFSDSGLHFIQGPPSNTPNYWLCSVLFENDTQRERFLELTNDAGIMTRPAWEPLHKLDPYQSALTGDLDVTLDIASRLVNIPSSVR